MAITLTTRYTDSDGDAAAATKTSTSQSFTAGNRVMVVAHALRNGHSAGFGVNWAVTDSATTNNPTWTELAFGNVNNWSATFEMQSVLFVSSELTATESFTVTIDANSGGAETFYYVLQVFEVTGANGALVQAGASTATTTTSGAPTLGAAPAGYQLIIGTALCSGDSIVWNAAPSNFSAVSGSTVTPVGGMSASVCSSTTNTGTSVTWGWSNTETTLATNMLLVELDEGGFVSITQSHYRWGLDDGTEAGHTFAAAEDTGITVATGLRRLLRVQLDETGGADDTAAYTLQYKRSDEGADQWRDL